jgi:asparagine synthase (glutamine-hydrolysing)
MASAKSQLTFRTPYLDNDLVALTYRAPLSVRRSSASALRLVRDVQPRLGRIATDRALMIDGSGVGYLLKRLFAELTFKLDYVYTETLPPPLTRFDQAIGHLHNVSLLGLHKYLPYRVWFRQELGDYVTGVLTDPSTSRLPYWNDGFLTTIAQRHVAGRRNFGREINAVVTLAAVDRLLRRGGTSTSGEPETARDETSVSECLPR